VDCKGGKKETSRKSRTNKRHFNPRGKRLNAKRNYGSLKQIGNRLKKSPGKEENCYSGRRKLGRRHRNAELLWKDIRPTKGGNRHGGKIARTYERDLSRKVFLEP